MPTLGRRTAICRDAEDGGGDLVVQIPQGVIEAMRVRPGDKLELEIVERMLVITPCRNVSPDA